MKKFIVAMLLALCVLTTFVSCKKKVCDECGSTKNVKEVTFMGVTSNLCEDCRAELEEMKSLLDAVSDVF